MDKTPLYRTLASQYRSAIENGALKPGERFPSVRVLMSRHGISLSTALQACRTLETEGWLEARPRSGNFVRHPRRLSAPALREPNHATLPDPAQFVGIHAQVSDFVARGIIARSKGKNAVRVNFSGAACAPSLYPGEALKNAATRALRRQPDLLVKNIALNGNLGFRSVLARRAMESGMVLSPDEIVVTHGCIEALNVALRAVTQPGDIIAVESPTYFGLLQVLESLGLRALEIPTSPQTGISLEALELATQTYPDIKAVVVVPILQNPLGSIMPDTHKARLVAFCDAAGAALIEDDTYGALANDAPQKSLKHWDKTGNVIHCASLHKILAAGMRLGWITAGRWQARVEMLKYAQTRSSEELSQLAAGEFIASSAFDRYLRRLRGQLADQRTLTAATVANCFPEGTRFNEPSGGLMLWIELPSGISSQTVFNTALDEGILVAPGQMFSNSNRFDNYLRLNCGLPFTGEVEEALQQLGRIVSRFQL